MWSGSNSPLVKVDRGEACLEMVDKKSKDRAQSVGSENTFLVLDDSTVVTFYKGEEAVQDF